MTNLQINFEISKVVGFKRHYTDSLDAMHEAEKVLTLQQKLDYTRWLKEVVLGGSNKLEFELMHSTATQRAESFLRTLNLWDDKK